MMGEIWKSPRKIEEEIKAYRGERFERYMTLADRQELSRELAIAALRDEIASDLVEIGVGDERTAVAE